MITRKSSFVVGAIVALTLGSGTAYAATGGNVILGKANTAKKATTLSNTKGSPLTLNAKRGSAPLTVNSSKVVAKLNADLLDGVSGGSFLRTTGKSADADKLDGVDSSSFALATAGTGYVAAAGLWQDYDADGLGDALIAAVTCPAGSKLTGGGVDNYIFDGTWTLTNSPGGNTWYGTAVADQSLGETADNLVAYAVCFNPRGPVGGGAVSTTSAAKASPQSSSVAASPELKADLKRMWLTKQN